jgi:hypothetical protein
MPHTHASMKQSRVLIIAAALVVLGLAGITAIGVLLKSAVTLILGCIVPIGIVILVVLIAAWQTQRDLSMKQREDAPKAPSDNDYASH